MIKYLKSSVKIYVWCYAVCEQIFTTSNKIGESSSISGYDIFCSFWFNSLEEETNPSHLYLALGKRVARFSSN